MDKINSQLNLKENEKLRDFFKSYINFIVNQNELKNSSSKNFFILVENPINEKDFSYSQVKQILNEKFFKIKDSLSRCGNLIFDVSNKKEVENILYSFCNLRKNL